MRKLRFLCLEVLCMGWAVLLSAQRLPHYDLLLFSINQRLDSLWHPFAPRFLTAFNPEGYNNQPCFFSPHEVYLTVQQPPDTTQTDLYALNLLLNTITRVTATTTSEYSPARMPDGKHFSAVRVEANGQQRLWALPLDRSSAGYPLLSDVNNIGYYCWLRDTLLALFLVGDSEYAHALALASIPLLGLRKVAVGIGRCLQKTPDGRLSFVQKIVGQGAYLKTYDPTRGVAETLIRMPEGTEDFALLPDGAYWVGHGSRLLQFHPHRQRDWVPVTDLSPYGIRTISRIAISPDGRLSIFVVE